MIIVLGWMFYGFWALSLQFATCECVQRFTNTFSDINDTLVQLTWYTYPVEVQRLLVPFIMYAQKPVGLTFFGSISCSREQFRKVELFFSCKNEIFSIRLMKNNFTLIK